MKKFLSFLLAAMLVLGMVATANADGDVTLLNDQTYTITINGTATGHTYEAYQIFKGTLSALSADSKASDIVYLSDVAWGSGVDVTSKVISQIYTEFSKTDAPVDDAATLANALALFNDNSTEAKKFAEMISEALSEKCVTSVANSMTYTISGLEPGYYLVKDQDDSVNSSEKDAYTAYIMQVVKNVTATPKSHMPSSQKKVMDVCDSNAEINGTKYNKGWNDSADYDIGDAVPFQLMGTIPETYADFDEYKLTFHDTQSSGLDWPDEKSFKAYAVNENETIVELKNTTDYTYAKGDEQGEFTVTFNNLKTQSDILAKAKIFFEYTAVLNQQAVVGSQGNPNEMYMTYSNNPYNTENYGTTITDKVIVFTYKLVINKIDDNSAPLAGAAFTLYKLQNDRVTYKPVADPVLIGKNDEETTFTFTGLDDGTYKLEETTTPDGYNTMEPIVFMIRAHHDAESDNPALTQFDGSADGAVVTFTADKIAGSLSANVVNNHGATLPSTGGIGTTIFYLLGSIMFIGAAMTLVVRRRADAEEV